jgi:hypothetical protein
MGRADIANYGKRFSTEYQPARRGRPKGSLNRRTILRAWLTEREPTQPELIEALLVEVFGKRKARRIRRRGPARKPQGDRLTIKI